MATAEQRTGLRFERIFSDPDVHPFPCDITPITEIKDASGHDWSWAFVWFKPVFSFSGYLAGTDGSIWGSRGRNGKSPVVYWRRLKTSIDPGGRHSVTMYMFGRRFQKTVHSIILDTFVGPRPSGKEACHYPDRDQGNNAIWNLRWDTKQANSRDALMHGTRPRGESHGCVKLADRDIDDIRQELVRGVRQYWLANRYGVSPALISIIATGKHRLPIDRLPFSEGMATK